MESSPLTGVQVEVIQARISEAVNDCVEILHVDERYGELDAFISYDGTDNKGHKGHVYFTCSPRGSKVEDLIITNITGPKIDTSRVVFDDYC